MSGEEELQEIPFDEEVKSYLRSVEYDMGIELGVLALRDFIKLTSNLSEVPNTNDVNLLINSINQKDFLYFLKRNENALVTIAQWVDSPLRQEQEGVLTDKIQFIKDKNFKDLSDALEYANEWHTSLPATGVLKNPTAGRIIERYPDGYYWVDLGTNKSTDEAQAMGHCGTDFRATTLLSLRDEKGEPHVTVAYDADEKQVRQVKGKQNKKPVEKYMQYVKEFLKKLVKEDKLVGFEWSYPTFGSDLNDEEVREIMMANKKLYFQQLKKGVQQTVSNLGIR